MDCKIEEGPSVVTPKMSRLAVFSMKLFVIGFILLFFTPLSLWAFICFLTASVSGEVARWRISRQPQKLTGRRRANVCSIISFFFAFFAGSMVFLEGTAQRRLEYLKTHTTEYNMKILHKTILEYSKSNEGRLPVADQWCDQLMVQNEGWLECF